VTFVSLYFLSVLWVCRYVAFCAFLFLNHYWSGVQRIKNRMCKVLSTLRWFAKFLSQSQSSQLYLLSDLLITYHRSSFFLQFVPKTHYFFSVSKDKTVKYWDADKFEHITTLQVKFCLVAILCSSWVVFKASRIYICSLGDIYFQLIYRPNLRNSWVKRFKSTLVSCYFFFTGSSCRGVVSRYKSRWRLFG